MRYKDIELWADVEGYEGLYRISSHGRVYSVKKKRIMSPLKEKTGYLRVHLIKDGKRKAFLIHRLVAKAFLPNWFDDMEINHLDEDKVNNHVDNLEWCDRVRNINYGDRTEKARKTFRERFGNGIIRHAAMTDEWKYSLIENLKSARKTLVKNKERKYEMIDSLYNHDVKRTRKEWVKFLSENGIKVSISTFDRFLNEYGYSKNNTEKKDQ